MSHPPADRFQRQFMPIQQPGLLLLAAAVVSAAAVAAQSTDAPDDRSIQPGILQPLNSVVGSWRGVGQPKRGSRRGAWQEKTVCRWDFSGRQPAIRFDASQGRQFQTLTLSADPDAGQLTLVQHVQPDVTRTYHGAMPAKWPAKVQLLTKASTDGSRQRCTIEQLSDIRLVVLFERQESTSGSFRRVAGIGYTRSGHRLAKRDSSRRECVVTGGEGTIAVTHKGRTWYVCCEGCRQAFEDDPDGIIAAWQERQE